jgi:hypothetical protein
MPKFCLMIYSARHLSGSIAVKGAMCAPAAKFTLQNLQNVLLQFPTIAKPLLTCALLNMNAYPCRSLDCGVVVYNSQQQQ